MSTMQRLTLIGMYNYNPKLFDALSLPEQYDKNVFIDSLLIEHGEKLVLYSDIDFMAYSIGAWGRKWSLELTRIAEALTAEYNPIWNYDRYEEADNANNRNKSADAKNDNDNTSETTSAGGSTTTTEGSDDRTSEMNSDSKTEGSDDRTSETNSDSKTTGDTSSTSDSSSAGNNQKNIDVDSSMSSDDTSHKDSINEADFDITRENVTDGTKEYQISADNESDYQPERKEISNVGKQKETTDGTKDNINEDITSHHDENSSTRSEEKEQTNQTENVNTTQHEEGTSSNEGSATESGRTSEKTTNEGSTTESGRTSTSTTNADNSGSSTTSHGGGTSNSKEAEDFTSHHGAHMWGNIGVTTSASMVTEITQQRIKYNLYNTACRLFANELLIGIY